MRPVPEAIDTLTPPEPVRRSWTSSPKDTQLSAREKEICQTIGPKLRERGLIFVGIDVIGGLLTEINVTSPTGIRAIKNLGGPDVAAIIWDKIEQKRKGLAGR